MCRFSNGSLRSTRASPDRRKLLLSRVLNIRPERPDRFFIATPTDEEKLKKEPTLPEPKRNMALRRSGHRSPVAASAPQPQSDPLQRPGGNKSSMSQSNRLVGMSSFFN